MSYLGNTFRPLGRIARPLSAALFPPTCWATGVAIAPDDRGLSPAVRVRIAHSVNWPYCRRCGATAGPHTQGEPPGRCVRCAVRNLGVASVARAGTFDPPFSTLVSKLKFNGRWEIARLLAPFVWQAVEVERASRGATEPIEAFVPVPLHWTRRLTRGFNQSEELAREVGRLAKVPVVHALRRTRRTHAQAQQQSVTERAENLKQAFAARPTAAIAGRHVYLIDDVCTTGATLHAAAVALKMLPRESRPASIRAAVVCVTDRVVVPELTPEA